MYVSLQNRDENFHNCTLLLGSHYAKYFKNPRKSSRKLNVVRKVTLPNNNARNRKTANDNKTNFKKPATNKGGIISRNPSSINISTTKNSVRKTALPNNNQRNVAKNYMKLFQKHTTTRSRVNESNPAAINVKKQTPLPLLKSGNSKGIKRPITNKSSVNGGNSRPTKFARPTSVQSRKNPINKQGE